MIDRDKFFGLVRASVFGGAMTQKQVDGVSAILDEGRARGTPPQYLAYFLATPCIETGKRFEPIEESLNYSVSGLTKQFSRTRISTADCQKYGRSGSRPANQEAIGNIIYGGDFGRAQLGNTEPGDGYLFRGRGLCQLTGRRNYTRASELAGVDLTRFPERAKELRMSVVIMFDAMSNGWFTGKKLSDYLNKMPPDFVNARRTINGLDRATDIAVFARLFLEALTVSEVAERPVPPPRPVERPTAPVQPPNDAGLSETAGPDGSAPGGVPSPSTTATGGGALVGGGLVAASGGRGLMLWIGLALLAGAAVIAAVMFLRRKK